VGAGGEFKDILHRLEVVLQEFTEGMWLHIQDEGDLEQCVGLLVEWQTLICREAVAGEAMTGWLPPGLEGPLASGAPSPERGLGGGSLEAP
jgi:hypothetical protein